MRSLILLLASLLLLCAQPEIAPKADFVYPNAKQCSAPWYYQSFVFIPEGISFAVYCVNEDLEKVLDYYKKMQGYEVEFETGVTTYTTPQETLKIGSVLIKKGGEAIGVTAISGKQGETVFWLMKGPLEKLKVSEEAPEKLPPSDQASGEEPIKRYPKAVMLSYYKSGEFPIEIDIDYGSMDSVEKIFGWYKNYLISEGWKLEEEGSSAENWWLTFTKAKEIVWIEIYPPDHDRKYTLINLDYEVYRIPEKDLVSGEEPLQRYPNSKMISQWITTVPSGKMISIRYVTTDDFRTVSNWFIDYLSSAGWQITIHEEKNLISIFAISSKGYVTITITSKAGYSEIEVNYHGGV